MVHWSAPANTSLMQIVMGIRILICAEYCVSLSGRYIEYWLTCSWPTCPISGPTFISDPWKSCNRSAHFGVAAEHQLVEAALMGTSWCANFTTRNVLRIGRRYHLGVAAEHQLVVAVEAAGDAAAQAQVAQRRHVQVCREGIHHRLLLHDVK